MSLSLALVSFQTIYSIFVNILLSLDRNHPPSAMLPSSVQQYFYKIKSVIHQF
jgi:hypothetical protein